MAWLDLLAGSEPRGVVTRAAHLDEPAGGVEKLTRGALLRRELVSSRTLMTVPARWPSGLLRPATVRAHNELRFRRSPRREQGRVEPYGTHMFPLDGLDAWPRLYGRGGLFQYQLVVPRGAEATIRAVLACLAGAGAGEGSSRLRVLSSAGRPRWLRRPLAFRVAAG